MEGGMGNGKGDERTDRGLGVGRVWVNESGDGGSRKGRGMLGGGTGGGLREGWDRTKSEPNDTPLVFILLKSLYTAR